MARAVLVGLPGAGKSTVARALGHFWDCGVVDTDDEVAQRAGVDVAELLRTHGEIALRTLELDVLNSLKDRDVVVATGGGVVTTTEARALLREEVTVWLDCDDATLVSRLGEGDRPLLGDDWTTSLARLRVERSTWYEEVARERVDASGSVVDVVARVVASIGAHES
ncbi:MAG TPA: shikimate kinase [Acidimicrobiales bacterium]|nr:shikimate kinase [Acidimicrobiales bacterium]